MDSNTKRRKVKLGTCIYCTSEFKQYNYENKKFCSRKCFYESLRDQRPKHQCSNCSKEIQTTKYRETRNEEYYCSKECYNNRRKKNLKRLKRSTKFYNDLLENSSCKCGISEKFLLQIHHIDGDRNNNNSNNLEIVCANCHVRRHLIKDSRGEWVYNSKSLTPREQLLLLDIEESSFIYD